MKDQPATLSASMPRPGHRIAGQYELVREVGRGAMGVVWKARDDLGERVVCIKFLPIDHVGCAEDMARMKATFRCVHRLQHENLCPHHAYGIDERLGPFIVMKLFKGPSLAEWCVDEAGHRRCFPIEEVLQLLAPIAAGLDYLHSHGLVHRDIKPANIMAGARGRTCQIVDFGLVERLPARRETDTHSAPTAIAGSGAYLAPEIWQGHRASPATDQYALATIVYEMLAGRRPFEQAQSAGELMKCVLQMAIPPIDGIRDDVNRVLRRALSKCPDDRYRSNRAMMHAFRNAARFEQAIALPPRDMDETIVLGPKLQVQPSQEPSQPAG